MTEQEWLACTDPLPMLESLPENASDRKLRLFACAFCRHLWDAFADERLRKLVEATERYVDGLSSDQELGVAAADALAARQEAHAAFDDSDGMDTEAGHRVELADYAIIAADPDCRSVEVYGLRPWPWAPDLLREIFGGSFHPMTFDPAWRTPEALALAHTAYDERQFPGGELDAARLAVLADALEEGGCTAAELLLHLRGPGPHVRGCWAVDQILGKE